MVILILNVEENKISLYVNDFSAVKNIVENANTYMQNIELME